MLFRSSMNLNSALIPGASSLFGIKSNMQFGKLKVSALASQQRSSVQNVSTKGGVQKVKFDIPIDQYDANRHFFLAQYFRDTYDKNMLQLPYITSADRSRVRRSIHDTSGYGAFGL